MPANVFKPNGPMPSENSVTNKSYMFLFSRFRFFIISNSLTRRIYSKWQQVDYFIVSGNFEYFIGPSCKSFQPSQLAGLQYPLVHHWRIRVWFKDSLSRLQWENINLDGGINKIEFKLFKDILWARTCKKICLVTSGLTLLLSS